MVAVIDDLTLQAARQMEIAREHAARVDIALASIAVALKPTGIVIAIAWVFRMVRAWPAPQVKATVVVTITLAMVVITSGIVTRPVIVVIAVVSMSRLTPVVAAITVALVIVPIARIAPTRIVKHVASDHVERPEM